MITGCPAGRNINPAGGSAGLKYIYVATFGCQMNEYDSERMIRLMAGRGFVPTDDPARADLILLNTCSIRAKAEQKVYSLLGRLRPLKEAKPHLIIGVGGCVAQQEGKKLLDQVPFLDLVFGTHGVHLLPELVDQAAQTGRPVCYTDFNYELTPAPALDHEPAPIKAYLTIMQGCDNFCAYCVVPYVRGREKSRRPEDILTEARNLLSHGVKEITLLGQNVNSYGRGLEPEITFTELIRQIAELPGLSRLRFTTSHPKDLSPDLVRALAEIEPLCEHLHLPVQSGSNRILKAMNRGYTREDYLGLVEALREARPDLALTTDVIVGFPGESEADFGATLDLIDRVRYDGMYSFKYSDRPMTRATRLPDKVDEAVKARRLAELQAVQKETTLEKNRALTGRRVEVLVEGRSARYAEQLTGRTRTNKIVNFVGPDLLIGKMAEPVVIEAWANSLIGRLSEGRDPD